MSESQADFLRRLNIANFHRHLAGDLTEAQRAMVVALLGEAEARDVNTPQHMAPAPMKPILEDDTLMNVTEVSCWSSDIRTAQQAALAAVSDRRRPG